MKRIIALTFLSIYLFSTTEFHELLKLPAMVVHYKEHQKEKPALSVWNFVTIHYAHGDVQDKDHEKDMKLPFKTHDSCGSYSFISLIPDHPYSLAQHTPSDITKNIPVYYNEAGYTHSLSSIWQPPKVS